MVTQLRLAHDAGARRPGVSGTVASVIMRLASIPAASYHILSCYLQLRPEDRRHGQYRVGLRQRIQAFETSGVRATLSRNDWLEIERDIARLLAYVDDPANLPRSGGLALFACEALDLFVVVPLPRVYRTRLVMEDTPSIRELVAAAEDFGRVIVAVVGRAHARFFEVSAVKTVECTDGMAIGPWESKYDLPGWGKRDDCGRIEEKRYQHATGVVQQLETLTRQRPSRGIVIAGTPEHAAALARALPPSLAARLLGTTRLNPTAVTATQVQAAAFEVVAAHERTVTAAPIASLKDALGSGWAVEGPGEILRALDRGEVRQLFLRAEFAGAGNCCSVSRRLTLSNVDCSDESDAVPVQALADEVVEEALRQGVDIVLLHDNVLAAMIGDVAATLHVRYPSRASYEPHRERPRSRRTVERACPIHAPIFC